MTDEAPVETPVEEAPVEILEEETIGPANCRWCGIEQQDVEGDWLCESCGRYQDATTCPTCGSLTRVSSLPKELVPAPAKAKKGKD